MYAATILGINQYGYEISDSPKDRIVELNDVNSFLTINEAFAYDLIVQLFIVCVELLVFLPDFVEFDIELMGSASSEHRTQNHLVDVPMDELVGVLAQDQLDSIKNQFGNTLSYF